MDDLFTVVSLVIAVSGSTYAALAALRHHLGDRVEKIEAEKGRLIATIREARIEPTRKHGIRKYDRIGCCLHVWRWSYALPVAVFFVFSYVIAIHVCFAYWTGSGTPASLWWLYRFFVVGMVSLDGISIGVCFCAYWAITSNYADLKEVYASAVADTLGPDQDDDPPQK